MLTATKGRMRGSSHIQVLLEMAVVRLCRLAEMLAVGQLAQALTQPGALPAVSAASAGTAAPPRAQPTAQPPASEAAKKKRPADGETR